MTVEGHVEKGQVVLDCLLHCPDGTKVAVTVQPDRKDEPPSEPFPSLYERLKSVAGKAKGLPPDLAINHDHYLHGQPKRQ